MPINAASTATSSAVCGSCPSTATSQVALAKRDKALQRVLPKAVSLQLETWVTMHEDLRNSPRCRATFDALVEGLLQYIV
jgi:hypothetical protein